MGKTFCCFHVLLISLSNLWLFVNIAPVLLFLLYLFFGSTWKRLLPPLHLGWYNWSLSVFGWCILWHFKNFLILVSVLLRSCNVQLMMLKLHCKAGVVRVLAASVLLNEFSFVLNIAFIRQWHCLCIFSCILLFELNSQDICKFLLDLVRKSWWLHIIQHDMCM